MLIYMRTRRLMTEPHMRIALLESIGFMHFKQKSALACIDRCHYGTSCSRKICDEDLGV
jgi:hypothetical protein